MALSDEPQQEKKGGWCFLCPACGKRYDLRSGRRYCDCHARIDMDRVYGFDDDGIAIGGPVNVAYKDINCAECGAGCAVCYSFSVMKANHRGFGGRPCARAQDCLKCACCQIIIKNCSKDAMREIILGVRDMWLRRNS